jgi:feruloyl-CoA ortho-hydroxylase
MASCFEQEGSLFNFVVREGNGVKGLLDLGISKVPDQYIQPPNERIPEPSIDSQQYLQDALPIDLSLLDGPSHDQVAEAIVKAVESVGFFQVVNHGVPIQLLESLKDSAHRFFGQPAEKKAFYLKAVSPSPLVKYATSFEPDYEKSLEWRDYVSMAYTTDGDALNHWPNNCKEAAVEYVKTTRRMVEKIMEVLIGHLQGVTADDEEYQSRVVELVGALTGTRAVNMNFYPRCPNPDLTVGVGRHSDPGTLTVLLQDGIGGLYVKLEEEDEQDHQHKDEATAGIKKPQWMEVPPIPSALVVNVGDALQILSNGRYKSAEHRVRTTSIQSRVSIPLFTAPLQTLKIGPLPQLVDRDGKACYRDLLFQDYFNNYFMNAHEGKKSLDYAKITPLQ